MHSFQTDSHAHLTAGESSVCVCRGYYSMPHQARAQNANMVWVWDKEQVSVGRRKKYSTHSFALLLWRWKRSFKLSHRSVWQDPFMQAEETEKWVLGNYLQTELSWCLWNCSKIHPVKWDTVTIKDLLLKQGVEKPQKNLSNTSSSFFCYLI